MNISKLAILQVLATQSLIVLGTTSCALHLESDDSSDNADIGDDCAFCYSNGGSGTTPPTSTSSTTKVEFLKNTGKGMFTVGSNLNAMGAHIEDVASHISAADVAIDDTCNHKLFKIGTGSSMKHLVHVKECDISNRNSAKEKTITNYDLGSNTFQLWSNKGKDSSNELSNLIRRHEIGEYKNDIDRSAPKVGSSNDSLSGISDVKILGILNDSVASNQPDGTVSDYQMEGVNQGWSSGTKTVEAFGASFSVESAEVTTTSPDKINLEEFKSLSSVPKPLWSKVKNDSNGASSSNASNNSCGESEATSQEEREVLDVECTLDGGFRRTIQVIHNPENGDACEMWYQKPTEGIVYGEPLWHAHNPENQGFCEDKANALIQEHEDAGWVCD